MREHALVATGSKPSKTKTTFLCQDCGHTSPKWDGRCPGCGAWGTYVEFNGSKAPAPAAARRPSRIDLSPSVAPLAEQPGGDEPRIASGMAEVDRLLGGGVVAGSVMLLAGDPGIGR